MNPNPPAAGGEGSLRPNVQSSETNDRNDSAADINPKRSVDPDTTGPFANQPSASVCADTHRVVTEQLSV